MRGILVLLSMTAVSCAVEDGSIMAIQGEGLRSPVEGSSVTAIGIVTAARSDGRGFWIQHETGDGNPRTSDAVSIWTELATAPGDRVRVRGTVAEFARDGGLSTTQIQDIQSLDVLSSGHPLPRALELSPVPENFVVAAIDYWSRREGMLVAFERALVVGPTSGFGETAVVLAEQAPEGNHVFVRSLGDGEVDYNPERILIDDEVTAPPDARPGDLIERLRGVVDYSFGNYKLQAIELEHVVGSRTEGQPRARGGVAVASFNVENLFDDDPEELEAKVTALAAFIETMLLLPEILVVQEVENEAVLELVGVRLNEATGTRYRATALGSSDGRGIENALLYDLARVDLVDAFVLSGPDVDAAFGPTSPSPGREPLVGELAVGDAKLVVIGNHFKSKRGDDPIFGARQPFQRPTEVQRKAQARAVRRFLDERLTDDPAALILVAGDFNDFQFAEPGEGPDHPLGILEGEDFTNVIAELASPYTFIFDGNAQVLDHVLVSPALGGRLLGAEIVHGNADDPRSASDHDVPVVRLEFPD